MRMVTAVLARPWSSTLDAKESSWRYDAEAAGSGILADAGDHLIDALLWTTGQSAQEVGAIQAQTRATDRSRDGGRDSAGGRDTRDPGGFGDFPGCSLRADVLRRGGAGCT